MNSLVNIGTAAGSVIGDAILTHGTLESRAVNKVRPLYETILNLRCVHHSPPAQLIAGQTEFAIVSISVGDKIHEQGSENRWILVMKDADSVAAAREAALAATANLGIRSVGDIEEADGISRFVLHDIDSNWWEVTNAPANYYQSIFEGGDIS